MSKKTRDFFKLNEILESAQSPSYRGWIGAVYDRALSRISEMRAVIDRAYEAGFGYNTGP